MGSILLKLFAVTLLWVAAISFAGMKPAHAMVALNPSPGPMPAGMRAYLEGCDSGTESPAYLTWISLSGNPAATTFNVPYGTTAVSLDFHWVGATCFGGGNMPESHSHVSTSAPAGVSGIAGTVQVLNFNPDYASKGTYRESTTTFTYAPPGGFTSSGDHIITLGRESINGWTSGTFQCIGPPGSPSNLDNFSNCPTEDYNFLIHVDVPPPVTIQGRVWDATNSGINLAGVVVDTCTPAGPVTSSASGYYSFTVAAGQAFCIRPQAGSTPAGYIYPNQIWPWNENYYNCPGANQFCGYPTYENQVAGTNAANGYDRTQDDGYDIVFYPAPTFSCDTVNTNPSPAEAGAPFILSFRLSTGGGVSGAAYNYSATLTGVSGPGSITGYGNPAATGSLSGNSSISVPIPGLTANNPGYYNGTITVNFSGAYAGSVACPFNINPPGGTCAVTGCHIVNKPYFQLNYGDIAAGVPPGCSGWPGGAGTITGWNDAAPGAANKGAGTNLASYALNLIDGFASAQSPSGSSAPNDLSFANTTTYGGFYAAGTACPTDYYQRAQATPVTGSTFASGPPVTVPNNSTVNTAAGNITISGSPPGNINNNNRPVIYLTGDVYITGNIILNAPISIAQIPNFYLIVKGNIYIAPGVTQLDGVYVAQPNGATGGKIYTCSNNFGPPLDIPSQLNGSCNAPLPLTVNGAFIAKELKLYRSRGSMSNGMPAEIFHYTPSVWLAPPDSIGSGIGSGYDAITSLPPVL